MVHGADFNYYYKAHIIPMNRKFYPSFPKIHPHAPDTIQTPSWSQLSRAGKFKKVLWTVGKMLVERRSKYAIKAGMATAILASPAFCDATRPLFIEYWGDWALISVSPVRISQHMTIATFILQCFVVLSPTIGAVSCGAIPMTCFDLRDQTNYLSLHRIMCTL